MVLFEKRCPEIAKTDLFLAGFWKSVFFWAWKNLKNDLFQAGSWKKRCKEIDEILARVSNIAYLMRDSENVCFEAGQNSENNVEKIVLKTAVSKLFWFCFTAVSKLVCSWFGAGLKLFCSRVLAVFELFSSVLDLHTD